MVYFSCSGCNESLKKNKVANHLSFCRRCSFLTCLDCQKDFDSESYTKHNQCVSEVEKYGGPGYVLPQNANKGQKKQMGWMDSVRLNIDTFLEETKHMKQKKDEQILMTGLQRYDNIPRKKAKFVNFMKSSFARYRYNEPLIETVWNVVSVVKPEGENNSVPAKEETTQKEQHKMNGEDINDETIKCKIKKDRKDEADDVIGSSELNGNDAYRKKKKKKRKMQDDEESLMAETECKRKKKKRKLDEEEEASRKNKKKRKRDVEADEEMVEMKQNESIHKSNTDSEVEESKAVEVDESEESPQEKENGVESNMNGEMEESEEVDNDVTRKKKKKKRKRKESDEGEDNEEMEEVRPPVKRHKKEYVSDGFQQERLNETLQLETPRKFVIRDAVNTILVNKEDDGISMKKLEKRVLNEYQASLKEGQPSRPHKISSKLKTIVSKHFRLVNDRVFIRPEI